MPMAYKKTEEIGPETKTCIGCIINEPFIRELELELVNKFSLDVIFLKLDVSNKNNFGIIKDLNAFTVESAMKMIAGTARSMGFTVKGEFPDNP